MITFPVAVIIGNRVECILHIEKNELTRMGAAYCGRDKYSGYEIYADMVSGRLYAADPW